MVKKNNEFQALLSEVVSQTLFTEEHEVQHRSALRRARDTLESRQLLGRTHLDVSDDLTQLQERLSRHAKHSHAAALEHLTTELCAHLSEQGEEDDLSARLLSLLITLSQRPGCSSVPSLTRPSTHEVCGTVEAAQGNTLWSDGSGSFASTDTLSHWSNSEDEGADNAAFVFSASYGADPVPGRESQLCPLEAEDIAVEVKEVWQPHPPPTLERPLKHPPLAHRVSQWDAAAGRRRPPILEHIAVSQVIACLRGHMSDGPVLQLVSGSDDVEVVSGVHVAQLSAASLAALLTYFAENVSCGLRVRAYAERTTPSRITASSEDVASPAAAAFASALQWQVRQLDVSLLDMSSCSGSGGGVTTLLQAQHKTAAIVARLAVLEAAVEATAADAFPQPSAAAVTNGLVALLDRLLLQSGPQGSQDTVAVVDLLTATLLPLLQHTLVWLQGGGVPGLQNDFFVEAGDCPDPALPDFWHGSYRLRCGEGGGCPAFLQGAAAGIVAAGKGRILLRSYGSGPSPLAVLALLGNETEDLVHLCTVRLRKAQAALLQQSPSVRSPRGSSSHLEGASSATAFAMPQQLAPAPSKLHPISPSEELPLATAAIETTLGTLVQSRDDDRFQPELTPQPEHPDTANSESHVEGDEIMSPSQPLPLLPSWGLDTTLLPLPPLLSDMSMTSAEDADVKLPGGSSSGGGSDYLGSTARLRGTDRLQFPCAAELLQHCILSPIQQVVDATDAQLLQHLRDTGTMLRQLGHLKALFLLGAPVACDFVGHLFHELDSAAVALRLKQLKGTPQPIECEAETVSKLGARLQRLLVGTLSSAPTWQALPAAASVTVVWSPPSSQPSRLPAQHRVLQGRCAPSPSKRRRRAAQLAAAAAGGAADLSQVTYLSIQCRLRGAVTVTQQLVSKFNSIFTRLVQVRWVVHSLQGAHPRRGDTASPLAALRTEMLRFTSALHHWSLHTTLECAWPALEQAIRNATSLAGVIKAQEAFTASAAAAAIDPTLDRASALMAPSLAGLLTACKLLCTQWQRHQAQLEMGDEAAVAVDVGDIGQTFQRHRDYFCKVLRSRTREVGGDPALRRLLTTLQG